MKPVQKRNPAPYRWHGCWELKKREAARAKPPETPPRGYARLYAREILGADQGCDFDFLKPR